MRENSGKGFKIRGTRKNTGEGLKIRERQNTEILKIWEQASKHGNSKKYGGEKYGEFFLYTGKVKKLFFLYGEGVKTWGKDFKNNGKT